MDASTLFRQRFSCRRYRQDPVPVANVSASVRFTFPFSGFVAFFGDGLETVNSNIDADSRIFGL